MFDITFKGTWVCFYHIIKDLFYQGALSYQIHSNFLKFSLSPRHSTNHFNPDQWNRLEFSCLNFSFRIMIQISFFLLNGSYCPFKLLCESLTRQLFGSGRISGISWISILSMFALFTWAACQPLCWHPLTLKTKRSGFASGPFIFALSLFNRSQGRGFM